VTKDLNFPLIEYKQGETHLQWGISHGKKFKEEIKELAGIRKKLMLAKNPALSSQLKELALQQLKVSRDFAPKITEELEGIAQGAELPIEDIVILNNYTDFRDIQLSDEGCSTLNKKTDTINLSGQTWDMHSSAKRFVCVMKIPKTETTLASYSFSLVGCVGMMGINSNKVFIGVNNINTLNAKIGLIWPVLVRKALHATSLDIMRETLKNSPVTSGHNYLISDEANAEHWEITPCTVEKVLDSNIDENIFHTNHCLGPETKKIEDQASISSTTFPRFEILNKKYSQVATSIQFTDLLKDHEGHPKSICSHYDSGAQDPSMTCGGAVYDYNSDIFHLWRGCKVYDDNYVEYDFSLRDL